jgi:hypothetical protein
MRKPDQLDTEPARIILRTIEKYARGDPAALARDIIAELDRAGFVIVPRQPDKERPNGDHAD